MSKIICILKLYVHYLCTIKLIIPSDINIISMYNIQLIPSLSILELSIPSAKIVETFHFLWLRDHCRCQECYNHVTFQRKKTILEQPEDPVLKEYTLDNECLSIKWDDGHSSKFSVEWMLDNTYSRTKQKLQMDNVKVLWDKDSIQKLDVAKITYADYMSEHSAQKEVVASLLKYGVAMVTDVSPTEAATELAVTKLFPLQHTLFGDMWSFSDKMDHNDSAYTTDALGAHTDNTYFTEAAGLQILHCIHHTAAGGENLLVDGFHVASQLKKCNPELYSRLSSRHVPAEYVEEGTHYTATGPVFNLHPITGELEQIRFNVYDRSPLHLPAEDVKGFYDDMRILSAKVAELSVEWWFKLLPGTILFFDNWRLLHGRSAYTGHREMTGCYVSRADWLAKAKAIGF